MIEHHPLRTYRKKFEISLEDLAKSCQSTRATLSRVENRLQVPSLSLIERIVEATGGELRADDFLTTAKKPEETGAQ